MMLGPTNSYERSFEMLKPRTPLRSGMMLVLPLALLSSGCGKERPRLVLPPIDRAQPVAIPTPPAESSDAEVAGLIAAYDSALREANRRLSYLRDWIVTAGK
jgi:hypothetical protein